MKILIVIVLMVIAFFAGTTVHTEPQKTPRMENGCVIQESQGREIRTCG
jgi:hypothetical protein